MMVDIEKMKVGLLMAAILMLVFIGVYFYVGSEGRRSGVADGGARASETARLEGASNISSNALFFSFQSSSEMTSSPLN